MSNKRKLVDSANVGCGGALSELQTISCRFGDFIELPHERGDVTESPVLRCHGHEWKILLYPGGADRPSDEETERSNEEITHVAIHLWLCESPVNLRVKSCIRIGSRRRIMVANYEGDSGWGSDTFATRKDVLDAEKGFLSVDGTLGIEVDIQIFNPDPSSWRPKKKLQGDMLQLLDSADFSDTTFAIGEDKFRANSHILKIRAPTLASLAEDANGADVEISDVEPAVFRMLFPFIYGDELPPAADIKRNARALLEAANRFGCTDLKLNIEAEVVESILNEENAADWLVFSDAHSCALLKESAIAIFVSHTTAVRESAGWAAVKESAALLSELVEALDHGRISKDNSDVKRMSVPLLRKQLEERGLDVDGTREMLVERLEDANKKP